MIWGYAAFIGAVLIMGLIVTHIIDKIEEKEES